MEKTEKTEKGFDCIAFKERAQREIQEAMQGMTAEQRVAYIRRCAESGPFAELLRRLKHGSEAA